MEQNNGIRIKLGTFVIIFLIMIIIIMCLIMALVTALRKIDTLNNELSALNTVQDQEIAAPEENINDSELREDEEVNPEEENAYKPITFDIPEDVRTRTLDLFPQGFTTINNKTTLSFYIPDEEESVKLSLDFSMFALPPTLLDYKDDVLYRITYGISDQIIYKCEILNAFTNELITDYSKENIRSNFDIEYNREKVRLDWSDEILFSSLQEDKVYELISYEDGLKLPNIINDLPDNYLLYAKEPNSIIDREYEREIIMGNYKIESKALSYTTQPTFDFGDTYIFAIKKVTTEQLLKFIPDNEILRLSSYTSGQTIDDNYEEYIYNDTAHGITLNIKDASFGAEDQKIYNLESGKIYKYDWMIDEIIVEH